MAKLFRRDNRTNVDIAFDTLFVLLSVVVLLITLYPMYFIVIASFSKPENVMLGKVWVWVKDFTLDGYKAVLDDERVWTGYRNTLFYTTAGTAFSLFGTLPAAFALSRKELPGRNIVMFFFTVTMFFGGGLVPTFLVIKKIGMMNTVWVFIIPWAVSVYNVIISRTFFSSTIPEELLDAAKIDGCGYTRFFLSIAMPLSKAIIAVIGLYYAVGYWNEYFRALVYARDANLAPLQQVLRAILIEAQESVGGSSHNFLEKKLKSESMKYALILVSTLPIMMVYPFIQKYFTKGVMIGSIKG
ncbi:MAG: carbohydrate ABC transporter permease [Clostridia bacterium]|nr:carbohydrate ABC transporter permease [Clostridia bacterium]